ncbi:hypothetical protein LCGC14_0413250 [marine sediment metagenome]|uniref:Uncharacterized protein n=1 Tax=marine sediment metagenome TaxID=412755 RepID=A0A0F9W281_9ZZZZ
MKVQVKLYEIERGAAKTSKPKPLPSFEVSGSNHDAVRGAVRAEIEKQGREARSISFGPNNIVHAVTFPDKRTP